MFNIIIWEVRYKAFCASKLAQKLYEPCTLTRFRCAYAYCACDFPNVRILFIYLTDYSRSGSQFTRAGRTVHSPPATLQNLLATLFRTYGPNRTYWPPPTLSAFPALTINYGEPWTPLTIQPEHVRPTYDGNLTVHERHSQTTTHIPCHTFQPLINTGMKLMNK